MVGEQKNWGLVSLMDNAYDGVEAGMAQGIDAWGYRTGGEEKNYGDFIGPAREVNFSVLERLACGKSKPCRRFGELWMRTLSGPSGGGSQTLSITDSTPRTGFRIH